MPQVCPLPFLCFSNHYCSLDINFCLTIMKHYCFWSSVFIVFLQCLELATTQWLTHHVLWPLSPLTQDHGSCLGTLMTSCPTQVKAWWQNPPNSWPVIFHSPNRPPKTWNWLISKPSQYHSENTPWYKDAENQPFFGLVLLMLKKHNTKDNVPSACWSSPSWLMPCIISYGRFW